MCIVKEMDEIRESGVGNRVEIGGEKRKGDLPANKREPLTVAEMQSS